jgi:hypothetical protein
VTISSLSHVDDLVPSLPPAAISLRPHTAKVVLSAIKEHMDGTIVNLTDLL